MPKVPTNHRKSWTPPQTARLRKLAMGNTPTRVIALKMQRTPPAIQKKASNLGVSLKPPNQSPYGPRRRKGPTT